MCRDMWRSQDSCEIDSVLLCGLGLCTAHDLPTVLLCFSAAVIKHWPKLTWRKERVYFSIQVLA